MSALVVSVTQAHLDACPDLLAAASDDNPVARAVLAALRAEASAWRERIPEGASVEVLATEGYHWKVALVWRVPPPWDAHANLWTWRVTDGDAVAAIDAVMHGYDGADAPAPFTFELPLG